MSCTNCDLANTDIKPAGCKSNGYCSSEGCNKLNTFDWLNISGIPKDKHPYPIVEVRFKNGRKEYFKNDNNLELYPKDWVVVDVPNGHHIGRVSLQGELVRLQIRKKKIKESDLKSIYRKANKKDLEIFEQAKNRETSGLYRSREIIQDLKLEMKLSDVEFQADNTKATFYYSADERVDFRELIKKLASEFRIRVEMKQISLRHEAGILGGIGSCGRELCCSTWISEFKSVSTSAARYQNLSINPNKLSGQCGRLKCCLNYELDTYMAVLKDIPKVNKALKTKKGEAYLMRTDIFRKLMYFSYKHENIWHALKISRVIEIQKQNETGIIPESIVDESEAISKTDKNDDFIRSSEELDALDRKYKKKKKSRKGKKKKGNA